jgi:hypothetical protein
VIERYIKVLSKGDAHAKLRGTFHGLPEGAEERKLEEAEFLR